MAHYIAAQAQGGGGLDIYLDDGRRPIGSVRQALDGRGIGEIRSPDGYVARALGKDVSAVYKQFQQWVIDGMPKTSALVRQWKPSEARLFLHANLLNLI